jgi:hypothetical protein
MVGFQDEINLPGLEKNMRVMFSIIHQFVFCIMMALHLP